MVGLLVVIGVRVGAVLMRIEVVEETVRGLAVVHALDRMKEALVVEEVAQSNRPAEK